MKYLLIILVLLFGGCELDDGWFFSKSTPKPNTVTPIDAMLNKAKAVDSTPRVRAVIKEHQDKLESIKLDSVFKTALHEHYKYIETHKVEIDSIRSFYHNKLDSLHIFYETLDMKRQSIYNIEMLKIHQRMLDNEIIVQKKINELNELKKKSTK